MLIMTFLKLHWIWWTISANCVSALLNGSMSAWREAKSKLRTDLLSHRAVIEKLCPAESNSKVNMEFYFYTYGVRK
ncbi:hypothetical protein Bpfe_017115 [Biomphalaria pfeifferi]|uniref:Secreted protein n=1 Tax=Biomphalaria pfeifferi TaxID=112525 RepID=A0AAD8F6D4_BIOPF|nr:hypothetical protein Bpfe_017115 [Biomphalaria pfeifferi]